LPGTVLRAADAGIDVVCGEGVLRIRRLQLAGRRPLTAAEFTRSAKLVGARFVSP
jgi:methionyl-tRNA formyltransferase